MTIPVAINIKISLIHFPGSIILLGSLYTNHVVLYLLELLWTAPEHLHHSDFLHSCPGDVYSYGMILQEILLRDFPFHMFESFSAKGRINFNSLYYFKHE